MELKKTLSTATLLLASTFVLAACGGADTETETNLQKQLHPKL